MANIAKPVATVPVVIAAYCCAVNGCSNRRLMVSAGKDICGVEKRATGRLHLHKLLFQINFDGNTHCNSGTFFYLLGHHALVRSVMNTAILKFYCEVFKSL